MSPATAPLPTIVILGYSEAAMYLRGTPSPNVSAILSIHGSREFGVNATAKHRLDLTFDDVEVPVAGDAESMHRAAARRRWADENGLTESPPTAADAAAIIAFADAIRAVDGVALFHCGAGMSRAPAAALIAMALWRGPGTEAACVAAVRAVRRGAVPHAGLVRLADHLLGRGGALVRALSEVG